LARSATAIQAELDLWYAARAAVASGQSYSLDSGQGRQTVTRANLRDINSTIDRLESDLRDLTGESGPTFITFDRGAC
jgi:hypothetical protein